MKKGNLVKVLASGMVAGAGVAYTIISVIELFNYASKVTKENGSTQ